MSASGPDGRFMQVNAAFCHMLGYTEQELVGTAWPRLIHPDDLELSMRAAERLLKEGGHIEMEKRYLHRSGKVVWGRMRMSLARDPAGEPQYFVIHVEDITERRGARGGALGKRRPLPGDGGQLPDDDVGNRRKWRDPVYQPYVP